MLTVDTTLVDPIVAYLIEIASDLVVPSVRIPMTASSWLGVVTNSSRENFGRYPNLEKQYQSFITELVNYYTKYGIVTILDLHWTDDDTENAPMAGKSPTNCVDFWDSVQDRLPVLGPHRTRVVRLPVHGPTTRAPRGSRT